MTNVNVRDLKSEVASSWKKGKAEDMSHALDLVLDQWGDDFRDYLDYHDYQSADNVVDDLRDELMDAQSDNDTEAMEEIQDKIDDVNMDGGPLWDVSSGDSSSAENVFVDDFLDIIDDYARSIV